MRWCLNCETEYSDTVDCCPNCGSEFFTDEPISAMPAASVESGRVSRENEPVWPLDAEGAPVKPILLETIMGMSRIDYDMKITLLHSHGVPTLQHFPKGGGLGNIILGFSGTGLDIYVPETMLDEARSILDNRR